MLSGVVSSAPREGLGPHSPHGVKENCCRSTFPLKMSPAQLLALVVESCKYSARLFLCPSEQDQYLKLNVKKKMWRPWIGDRGFRINSWHFFSSCVCCGLYSELAKVAPVSTAGCRVAYCALVNKKKQLSLHNVLHGHGDEDPLVVVHGALNLW